mgnify:CR=1 FL=1
MQRVVFFSGMGADERAFSFLKFSGITSVFVNWIEPEKDESLKKYALRLIANTPIYADDILIGLSMGGFVAQEIASQFPVKKVILISTLRSGEALKPLFTAAQKLHLLNLVNADILKSTIVAGVKMYVPQHDKRLRVLIDMLDKQDGEYYKWAMNAVLNWQGADVTCPVYHVHGDKDEVFPVSKATNATIVKGGHHFMLMSKAEEVGRIVQNFIDQKE